VGDKNEWLGLIDVAHLEVEALYGDFRRASLATDSREYIFVCRRTDVAIARRVATRVSRVAT